MKILIRLLIEVDPKEWDAVYGQGSSPDQVRKDVRQYVLGCVEESAGIGESEARVTLKD